MTWNKLDTLRGSEKEGAVNGIDPGVWFADLVKRNGLAGKKFLLILKVKNND